MKYNKILVVGILLFVCCSYVYAAVSDADARRACKPLEPGSAFAAQCGEFIDVPSSFEGCVIDVKNAGNLAESNNLIDVQYDTCAAFAEFMEKPTPTNYPLKCSTIQVTPTAVKPNEAYTLTIKTFDINNIAKTTGGDDIAVTIAPTLAVSGGSLVDNNDGTYTYTAQAGECDFDAALAFYAVIECRGFDAGPTVPSTIPQCETNTGGGDPHFVGYWRQNFDYQGVGDYYLATFRNIVVQNRQQQTCGAPSAACNVAIAVKFADNSTLELFVGGVLKLNGVVTPVPAVGSYYNVSDEHDTITRTFATSYVILTAYGKIRADDYGTFFNVYVTARAAITQGIFSKEGRNGEVFGATAAFARPFGDSWRVKNEPDSVFTYPPNTFNVINQPNATQVYECTNTPAIVAKAEEACKLLSSTGNLATQCAAFVPSTEASYQSCMFDILCTGEDNFAQSALDMYSEECAKKANVPISLPTSARKSTASGPGLNSPIARSVAQTFTIVAKDINSVQRSTGGDIFQISSTPSVVFNRVDQNNGTYKVLYIVSLAGTYTISVKTGGNHIDGSPFVVTAV